MVDHFHLVRLANHVVTEVRQRIQQEVTGHRGRKGDPLYGIRHLLLRGRQRLTDRQRNGSRPLSTILTGTDGTRSAPPRQARSCSETSTGPTVTPMPEKPSTSSTTGSRKLQCPSSVGWHGPSTSGRPRSSLPPGSILQCKNRSRQPHRRKAKTSSPRLPQLRELSARLLLNHGVKWDTQATTKIRGCKTPEGRVETRVNTRNNTTR